MPSTYTLNNGIELIATGEQSGTWGDTTNTNMSLLDTALDGQVTVTLASAGTSGSPNTLPISDGAVSDGRNRMVIFNDGADLGATAYVQLTPNDAEKIVYIRNALSGSRSIILFQGTYNASNDYEIPAGTTAVVYFNGGGTGAIAANVFNNAYFDSLRLGGVSVTAILDEDDMSSDSATSLATQQSIKAYVDSQVGTVDTLAEILANGNTTGGTDISVTTGDDVTFADSSKAIFGTDSDLQIYHASGESYVEDVGAGDLSLRTNGNRVLIATTTGETMGRFEANSYAKLYYDNVEKLATTSTGIDVTGTITGDETLTINATSAAASGTFASDVGYASVIVSSQTSGTGAGAFADIRFEQGGTQTNRIKVNESGTFSITTGTAGGTERVTLDSSGNWVFNETGADTDFRVESDTNTHALFVDAGNSRVGINTTPSYTVHALSAQSDAFLFSSSHATTTNFYINNTNATTNNTANLYFSPANAVAGAYIEAKALEDFSVSANRSASLDFVTRQDGNWFSRLKLSETATVFNESGRDTDFRIEGDGDQYLFFADAGTDRVGIKTSAPHQTFTVGGTIEAGDVSATNGSVLAFNSYAGATNDYIALWGTQYASGGPVMGYGLRSQGDGNWKSTYDNFSGTHSIAVLDGADFEFLADETNSQTTVGDNVTVYKYFATGRSGTVFNEDGRDVDFRVESDSESNMLFVDAGNARLGIGTGSPAVRAHLYQAVAANELVRIEQGTSSRGAQINFKNPHNSTTYIGLAGDSTGDVIFYNGAVSDNIFYTGGTERMRQNATETVINDISGDVDFRVESNGNTHAIFVNAGADGVGFGATASTVGSSTIEGMYYEIGGSLTVASNTETLQINRNNTGGNNRVNIGLYNNGTKRGEIGTYGAEDGMYFYTGSTVDSLRLTSGEAAFNEGGADINFRVESDTNTHALFVDAGNGHVNINTSLDSGGTLNVAGDIFNDLGNDKYFRRAKYIDPRGVCDGVYGGYLLLVPYNTGGPNVGAFMEGTFVASRGNSGTGNSPARCQVWCSGTYTNTLAWYKREGAGQFFQSLVRVTYSGTEYVALKFSQTSGGPVNGIYFDGWSLRADSNFLFMARDTEITGSETAWDQPDPYHYVETDGNQQFNYGVTFNEAGGDHDFRVESDTNTHALFVDAGNSYVGVNCTPQVELDVRRTANAYPLRIGSSSGEGRTMVFADISGTPAKHNWVLGSQYNTDDGWELTPSTAVGGYTFTNRVLTAYASTGNLVVNENGIDSDFRVESNNDTHMLFVDAGDDVVIVDGSSFSAIDNGTSNGIAMRRAGRIVTCTEVGGNVMEFSSRTNGKVGTINVTASATSYNTSSDARLKENIADADDAGELIDAIQVRQFDWIADGEHQRYGMVAQELNTVAPEAVSEGETEDDMMAVDYSKLVPMLVKEIQSLRARVAQLESN